MNTPVINHPSTESNGPATPDKRAVRDRGRRRRTWITVGGAAAAALAAVVTVAIINDDDGGQINTAPPLKLAVAGGDAMASCMPFDVTLLADMSPAFGGTVTSVIPVGDGADVTLAVDRWYAGGDAATVVLHSAVGMEALIGGFDFQVGQQYLITAAQGNVNFCGFSGLATPELTTAFDQAFLS